MVAVVGEDMRLIDDEDVLPEVPDEDEAALVTELGSDGLGRLDAALLAATSAGWRKGAMIVSEALQAVGQFPPRGGGWVDLATRRLGELVVMTAAFAGRAPRSRRRCRAGCARPSRPARSRAAAQPGR